MTAKAASERTIYLSRSERRIGGRRFPRFSGLDGVEISFPGESAALPAIHFGGGKLVPGLIAAMMHISGIALVIGFGAGYLADLSLVLSPRIPINGYGAVFPHAGADRRCAAGSS